jgi:hypothetical protein
LRSSFFTNVARHLISASLTLCHTKWDAIEIRLTHIISWAVTIWKYSCHSLGWCWFTRVTGCCIWTRLTIWKTIRTIMVWSWIRSRGTSTKREHSRVLLRRSFFTSVARCSMRACFTLVLATFTDIRTI